MPRRRRLLKPGEHGAHRPPAGAPLAIVVAGVAVVAALAAGVGATVQCYRVGEAGSRAVWTGNYSTEPLPRMPPH